MFNNLLGGNENKVFKNLGCEETFTRLWNIQGDWFYTPTSADVFEQHFFCSTHKHKFVFVGEFIPKGHELKFVMVTFGTWITSPHHSFGLTRNKAFSWKEIPLLTELSPGYSHTSTGSGSKAAGITGFDSSMTEPLIENNTPEQQRSLHCSWTTH